MGIEIETQTLTEVQQVRSRELQQENTEKLNQITSVVETIDEVDLQGIEQNTSEIKDMIVTNLDDQTDINELYQMMQDFKKSLTEVKKTMTRVNNNLKEHKEIIQDIAGKLEDQND